ncbi:hypothetical protein [Bifidobacterium sp. SO1]|uniref:hypothetical protein n=1 Tax=Bifidobacterium sp. SO1 TaxID=2809029 RepID=UPI001BDCCF87|nr:hypothetical protein [Bifidobacterium sp. SO1]MBT1161260.1 hypothetical protein [Bifidobacterium sp. SO1]
MIDYLTNYLLPMLLYMGAVGLGLAFVFAPAFYLLDEDLWLGAFLWMLFSGAIVFSLVAFFR